MKLNVKFHSDDKTMKVGFDQYIGGSSSVEVPTKLSELENDVGFITADDIPESGGGVTSWNDLEDKPFEDIHTGEIEELVSNLTSEDYYNGNFPPCNFVAGNTYDVIWNGENYNGLVCYDMDGYPVIGGEGYPFCIDDNGGYSLYIDTEDDEFTVSIVGEIIEIKPLANRYLDLWNYAKTEDLEGYAKTEDLESYVKTEDLEGFVKTEDLSAVATSGSYNDLNNRPFGAIIGSKDGYIAEPQQFSTSLITMGMAAFNPGIPTDSIVNLKEYTLKVNGRNLGVVGRVEINVSSMKAEYALENSNFKIVFQDPYKGILSHFSITGNFPVSGDFTMGIATQVPVYSTLDEKYIPDTIARKSDIPTIPSTDELVDSVIASLPIYNGEVEEV